MAGERERVYEQLLDFCEIERRARDARVLRPGDERLGAAHKERWREGLTEEGQEALARDYEKTLDRLEREGFHCAPELRRAYERQPA